MRHQLKKRVAVISIFLAGIILRACYSKFSPTTPQSDWLYGSWHREKSAGGFAGWVITPASEGYDLRYVFKGDNSFELFKDASLQFGTKFFVSWRKISPGSDSVGVINYDNGFVSQEFRFPGPARLILTDECVDCYVSTFVRTI